MSKRKGVSADEKRTRMLEIFHESEDFYQLKELEKLGPKEKGIVAQSVKDVVQSLVDDGLEDREPSDERTELLKDVSDLQAEVDQLKQELKKYEDNDPVVWEERKQRGAEAKIAANRWTDNIFAIKSWVSSKFNLDDAVVNKQFGIPEDLDYVD
ncbi:hypothetical protein B566_EDAN001112 [Ephemera danica]|nr:hypothetical protein B566_EDAN001112 [Ephemera danica]